MFSGMFGSSRESSGALEGAGSSKARSPALVCHVVQGPMSRTCASVLGNSKALHRTVHMAPPESESSPAESRKDRISTCLETLATLGTELVSSDEFREDNGNWASHFTVLAGIPPCNRVGDASGVEIERRQFPCASKIMMDVYQKSVLLELKAVSNNASGIIAI